MKIKRLLVFLSSSLILSASIGAAEISQSEKSSAQEVVKSESKQVKSLYTEFSKRLEISEEQVQKMLTCVTEKGTISLIPVVNSTEHLEHWKNMFMEGRAKPEYMQYYAYGKLKTEKEATENFNFRLSRMWDKEKPYSMAMITTLNGVPAGMIAIGSLVNFSDDCLTEIAYVTLESFKCKGITSNSVKMLLDFIRYLKSLGRYSVEIVRLTAKTENFASQKIALKNGFVAENDIIIAHNMSTVDFRLKL